MIYRSVTLKPGTEKKKVGELCDLLKQCDLFYSLTMAGGLYKVTLKFDSEKQLRVVCKHFNLGLDETE